LESEDVRIKEKRGKALERVQMCECERRGRRLGFRSERRGREGESVHR
jgi:hypothetical protein